MHNQHHLEIVSTTLQYQYLYRCIRKCILIFLSDASKIIFYHLIKTWNTKCKYKTRKDGKTPFLLMDWGRMIKIYTNGKHLFCWWIGGRWSSIATCSTWPQIFVQNPPPCATGTSNSSTFHNLQNVCVQINSPCQELPTQSTVAELPTLLLLYPPSRGHIITFMIFWGKWMFMDVTLR